MPPEIGAASTELRTRPTKVVRLATAAQIEAFYHQFYRPLIRRAIRRHGLSTEDARDMVQQAFAIALEKMQPEGNAQAWLRKVVDFLAVNLKRTSLRRASLLARWQPLEPDGSAAPVSADFGD